MFSANSKKALRIFAGLLIGLLFLTALVCVFRAYRITHILDSQFEAERWKGEDEESFCQVSCFMQADKKISVRDVNNFRSKALQELEDASVDVTGNKPFIDCWSCADTTKVYGMYGANASVIACGGNFFEFHPLKLVKGNYFSGDDLMQDNILLDEDLAWALYGGNDLEGQIVTVFGEPLRVAGVVARENDQASEKAYWGGMGLFMSYEKYLDLCASAPTEIETMGGSAEAGNYRTSGENAITCYEICMPSPVDGFVPTLVESAFPAENCEFVVNTGRFDFLKLVKIAKDFSERSMHNGVVFPYWENAARYAENKAAIFLVSGLILMLIPLIVLVAALCAKIARWNKNVKEDILPNLMDDIGNVMQRVKK